MKKIRLEEVSGRTVLEELADRGLVLSAPCGGAGRCGKCRVRVISAGMPKGTGMPAAAGPEEMHGLSIRTETGKKPVSEGMQGTSADKLTADLPVQAADREHLSETELAAGWRLACSLPALEGMELELFAEEEEAAEAVTVFSGTEEASEAVTVPAGSERQAEAGTAYAGTEEAAEAVTVPAGMKEQAEAGTAYAGTEKAAEAVAAPAGMKEQAEADPKPAGNGVSGQNGLNSGHRFGLAVDLGTTTVAAELIDLESGCSAGVYTGLNAQRGYGADVVTRISAAISGNAEKLRRLIREQLETAVRRLSENAGITPGQIIRAAVTGNTVMEHLLLGYPCDTLGTVPFRPYHRGVSTFELTGKNPCTGAADPGSNALRSESPEVNGSEPENAAQNVPGSDSPIKEQCPDQNAHLAEDSGRGAFSIPAVYLPGVSVFAGADAAAGLLACGFDEREELCFFLDLGTNGEMALGNRHRILCGSAAAGPAFEGGSLSCGTGSIPGAICSVAIDRKTGIPSVKTIGDQPAAGLCGTGAIEAAAELLRCGLMDETGLLADAVFEEGYVLSSSGEKEIRVTQKDIRELQLAKAAVRAAADTLLLRFGAEPEEVKKVFLAGGFGYRLDAEKAMEIGLLPEAFARKIIPVGNSALQGARMVLLRPDRLSSLTALTGIAEEISLADDPYFQNRFIESMGFP